MELGSRNLPDGAVTDRDLDLLSDDQLINAFSEYKKSEGEGALVKDSNSWFVLDYAQRKRPEIYSRLVASRPSTHR